jgi:hypothetical protein
MRIKILLVLLFATGLSWGQFSIATSSTNYTENFDSLTTGTWADGTTLTGWYARTDNNTPITTYGANTGTVTTAGLYAFGVAGTNALTDRALGYAPTNAYFGPAGTGKGYVGWRLKNNTGLAISTVTVTWTGEQWRRENNSSQTLNLTYQTGTTVTSLVAGTWTNAGSTFTSPITNTTPAAAIDGNAVGNRTVGISVTITVAIPAGDEIMLRWEDLNDSGADHQLAIDDVTVSAFAPCPATVAGGITLFSSTCGSTVLSYTGADAANCYWQTASNGTSTASPATANYSTTTSGTYYVRNFNGSCWSPGSASSTISVSNNPTITAGPSNASVLSGANATFTVTVTNPGTYQWQVDTGSGVFANVTNTGVYTGATTATLTITGATVAMSGYIYRCKVVGFPPCVSSSFSSSATLTVTSVTSAASDIIAVASSEALTVSSTINNVTIATATDGVQVWQFTVRDGGGAADADAFDTILTAFTLAQAAGNQVTTWSDAIFSIGLFDGTTFIANGTVTANQIQFTGLNVVVTDGTNKTLSLRLSLKCPLGAGAVDGNDFGFSLSAANTTFSALGSGKAAFLAATSANGANIIDITASKLIFTTQPVNTGQNNTMATVVVKATDACGNIDTGFTGVVSLSSTGTMNAVTPITMVAGVASFNTIVHTVVGTGYTLTASATGLTSGTSTTFNITSTTIFAEGDFAVVGVNSNITCYSGTYSAGDDEISFITFKDIQNGDVFYITDNGYERSFTGLWGETEGVYQFTRNGGTIPAGTVITFRFLNTSPFMEFTSPDSSWTFAKAPGFTSTLNTNSGGDQIFFMQGGTWNNPIAATHDATYTGGTLLYAFNTGTTWTSLANSTQQSALPLALRCFNMMPGAAADFIEYTGITTPASKYDWIVRLNDPTNWTNRVSCAGYTRMHVGQTYGVLADAYVNGVWTGSKSTDWFDCANWQTLKVPIATTDVSVNATYATKDAIIDVVANSTNASLYSNQALCNNITVSARKVQLEANTANTLDVHGSLTISGTGAIDMDDSNAGTADGQINLYGNWTNSIGNTAFSEGNGTVNFTGTGTQVINNVTPEGTETFYNVILNNDFNTGLSNDLIASNNLTVNANKTLTIDAAGYARVNNKLSNNGNVLIDSDVAGTGAGQLIQVNNTDTNDGTYTGTKFQVKRTAMAKHTDYVYWSSPLNTFDVSGIPTGYRYFWNTTYLNTNGTQGNWNAAAGNMTPANGYISRASNGSATPIALPITFNGSKPNNGTIAIGVSRGNYTGADYDADLTTTLNFDTTKYDDNWNLVGNPYPSAIDAESFLVLNQSVIEGSVWIWKHGLLPNFTTSPFYQSFTYNYSSTDYIKYNGLGSTEPDTFAGKIGSGQGFMVSMKDVGTFASAGANTNLDVYTSSISFNNTFRSDSSTNPYMPQNNTDFYKSAPVNDPPGTNPITGPEEKHRIWLDIINDASHQTDRMLLGYSTNSTMGRDNLYDCFFVPRGDVSMYSLIGNDAFIIQGRSLPFDSNDKVPLGINIIEAGSHTIAIKKVDGLFVNDTNIYLEDKQLQIIHDLKEGPYVFTTEKGIFNNRFVLRYNTGTLGNPSFNALDNSVVVSTHHGELNIKSYLENMQEVTVYDVLGRTLLTAKNINNTDFKADSITNSNQTLIVKIKLNNGTIITRKILL